MKTTEMSKENLKVEFKVPDFEELSFRQKLYQDTATIDGFCDPIDFSKDKWQGWYEKWIQHPQKRFYAYLVEKESRTKVGDVNYHYDAELNCYLIGVVILAKFRGKGYAQQGLKLLIEKAKANKIDKLVNLIPKDRTAALHIHKKLGFIEKECGDNIFLVLKLD